MVKITYFMGRLQHYDPASTGSKEATMCYFDEHKADRGTVLGGWIMVLVVNLGLVIATL